MGNRSLRALAALLLVLATLLSISGTALAQDGSENIVDTLTGLGNYVTLSSALVEKDVAPTLSEGEYTFFAAPDSAWQALSVADRIKLYRDPQTLTDTLLHHAVSGVYTLDDLTDGLVLTTLLGDTLTVTHQGSKVLVNGVEIASSDIAASNGIIQSVAALIPAGDVVDTAAASAATDEVAEDDAAESTEEAAAEDEATEESATEEAATEEAATEEAATEEAPAEETAAAEESAPVEETAAATPESAPESLPETGGASSALALFATAMLTVLGLGGLTFATRSRA